MLDAYRQHAAEREALGIPPLPLSAQQTAALIEHLKAPPAGEAATLVQLLTHRVPAGVDGAARVKASYLAALAHGTEVCTLVSREAATQLLGTMLGGYNIGPLIELLDDAAVGEIAANSLKTTLLMFDQFHDVQVKAEAGNANAIAVLQSWADAQWFTGRPEVPQSNSVRIFKVAGEVNTDDLSPAPDSEERLCMGNQAQVREGATVFSTSTRNFPNRLGKNANVYLGRAELAAICSKLGRIPTRSEYMADMGVLTAASDTVYQYLNFDRIDEFAAAAVTA